MLFTIYGRTCLKQIVQAREMQYLGTCVIALWLEMGQAQCCIAKVFAAGAKVAEAAATALSSVRQGLCCARVRIAPWSARKQPRFWYIGYLCLADLNLNHSLIRLRHREHLVRRSCHKPFSAKTWNKWCDCDVNTEVDTFLRGKGAILTSMAEEKRSTELLILRYIQVSNWPD